MTTVSRLIQPRDPLICRDGRPFAAGLRGRTMDWPYPSVVIGAARTSLIEPGSYDQQGRISDDLVRQLLAVRQRGPLPAWRDDDAAWRLAFPAPADVLPVKTGDEEHPTARFHPLRPRKLPDGAGVDLPSGFNGSDWQLAMPENALDCKPPKELPRFWKQEPFLCWLGHAGTGVFAFDPVRDGLKAPARDLRTHVSINPGMQAAEDGALFSTEGLDFGRSFSEDESKPEGPELALSSDFTLPGGFDETRLRGLLPVGGERRMAVWQKSASLFDAFNPGDLIERVLASCRLRLVLLTPAWFTHGWLAEWMREENFPLPDGSRLPLTLVSATVPRFVAISGWDLARRSPKPTRFLAPAGSVYFFELGEGATAAQLQQLWLASVCEEPETERSYRNDGFGLAAFGVWNPYQERIRNAG